VINWSPFGRRKGWEEARRNRWPHRGENIGRGGYGAKTLPVLLLAPIVLHKVFSPQGKESTAVGSRRKEKKKKRIYGWQN